MKKYYLEYDSIGGDHLIVVCETLFDFGQALERTMENSYINQETIDFYTK